jgi:opacity protein-like surface antigen
MRTLLLAATMAAACVTAAHAEDVMASRYGNTTIATDAKGVQTKIYYKADGTLTGKQGTMAFKGTWKVAKGQVCLTTQPEPADMANPFCRPVVSRKVGDTWKVGDRTVMLVKGIQ